MKIILRGPKKTKYHIELLRIMAILFVIFNHTGTNGFFLFSVRAESPFYWLYLSLSILCKIAVPIFYMISGALLLQTEETIAILFKKRIFRVLAVIFIFSLLQYTYMIFTNHMEFNVFDFLGIIYSNNIAPAYWYLYSYLGLLIMLPFLRKIAHAMNKNDYMYIFICQFIIVGVMPILQYLFTRGDYNLNGNISVPIITSGIFYFLSGHFFENMLNEEAYNLKRCVILIFSSILVIFISCLMTYYKAQVTGICIEKESQLFHNVLISVPTFTAYYCSKYFFIKVNVKDSVKKIILYFGSLTFGIMLLENILRDELIFVFNFLSPYLGSLLSCCIFVTTVFLCGTIVTSALKLMPGIKKII